MLAIKENVLRVLNPTTGQFESVSVIKGESTYDLAKAAGYTGTEEDYIKEHIPDEMLTKMTEMQQKMDTLKPENPDSSLDGLEFEIVSDHLQVTYDDEDDTSHTGEVGDITFKVANGAVFVTY
jgi:hypothetical protein